MTRVAVIDLGTVTCRLAIAELAAGERAVIKEKHSQIVNVGVGVDETRMLDAEAMARTIECVSGYVERIAQADVDAVCCTLTSAARDAHNSDELLGAFERLGLAPQVIPGKIEGSLTFLGVAQDFAGERILVADNGGGSTELACGQLAPEGLELEWVTSVDVGCRRLTDRFLSADDPPALEAIAAAHECAHGLFSEALACCADDASLPETLVVTGGTSTTLVAIDKGLDPYDPSRVHLARLRGDTIERIEGELAALTLEERGRLAGIQVKRAGVMLGGIAAVLELMRAADVREIVVSESDLLVGLSIVCGATLGQGDNPLPWTPKLSRI